MALTEANMTMEAGDIKIPKAVGAGDIKLFDTSCVFCMRKDRVSEGKFHCKYCGVLCEDCASFHEKMPKKGHWAAKLKFIVQPTPVPTFKSYKNCELHELEKISMYCIDCGELVCSVCREETHSGCDIETMDKMTKNMSRDKELTAARQELEDIRIRNNRARKNMMKEMKNLSRRADAFMDKILNIRQKFNTLFDSMLEIIIKDKNAFCSAEAGAIEERVLNCKEISPIFDKARQSLDEAYRTGVKSYLWIAGKKMQKLVAFYDKIVSEIETDKCDVNFEFVPSENLTNLLQETENIGRMKVTSSRVHAQEKPIVARPETSYRNLFPKSNTVLEPAIHSQSIPSQIPKLPAIPSPGKEKSVQLKIRPISRSTNRSKTMDDIDLKPKKFTSRDRTKTSIYFGRKNTGAGQRTNTPLKKFQFEEELTERQSGEVFGEMREVKLSVIGKKEIAIPEDTTENCITGCTYLKNGRLILVDYNNKSLKLYTSDFQLKTCLLLDERPWDVTGCLRTDIAVSYPFVNTVELVETSPDFKVKGKIVTDRKCHGLAFQRQHKLLFVACGEGLDARLQAYTLDGYVKRVIIPEEGVLHEPCFLTMSRDGKRVFLSDLDNGIVGFDPSSGAMLCQYKDEKVKRYWDLTADLHGHVFLITTNPDCLYVLMGEHNGRLLTTFEGDKKVCALCFDPITNNLVVSRWQSDEIELFRVVYS